MRCEHCARAIVQAIRAGDPGAEVSVDLAGGIVRADTRQLRETLVSLIEEEGYGVTR
ncbi:heavy-metal-associated domain-containing protein (plasmid) [Roseomonas marmotae]|uniref:Heavy-metal-associated domain-containing protein n=2 Tax=Roseomonas marmotae TaxID=2768161 RepID=A0ABS3KEE4_9PROT|nr:heavy-metal-associated domain-containing protein [Roseomonas marmotae]MBO1075838.1 heavy-metal-associated domain-containing protein [Roseomonas marmotae]QTI82031.1 heavy-metal-associated domain-containing protein [Roseomonas marmotae]